MTAVPTTPKIDATKADTSAHRTLALSLKGSQKRQASALKGFKHAVGSGSQKDIRLARATLTAWMNDTESAGKVLRDMPNGAGFSAKGSQATWSPKDSIARWFSRETNKQLDSRLNDALGE